MFLKYLNNPPLILNEDNILHDIRSVTGYKNRDNISRTAAYQQFFRAYPEIKWSFLASMVSRNAGWNMCDLEGFWLPRALSDDYRKTLFLTYERANWLIFDDAYPQLLLYHYSTKIGKPMFHLCRKFNISEYIEREWLFFWEHRDQERLMTALIVNEQNLIEQPVLQHPYYNNWVFKSFSFLFQDWLHFSTVLFPTMDGRLYGLSAYNFRNLDSRIELGKKLGSILFSKELYPHFLHFTVCTEHTGSRNDYEQYFPYKKTRETPFLRTVYPVINHHRNGTELWDTHRKIKKKWLIEQSVEKAELTRWYKSKQKQLEAGVAVFSLLMRK
ncbi:DUF2515 family protein [Peribacillus deserti]|uniref:DUF2515 domain-containing protein n=1 Tax=Peribacillus deserti TaxID=673318 RepID=A0A2N5M1Y6_9BACI|nr:DUF2515 family protein [Peribacillus deserti]PLT28370.1 DUF2515 domain-containing protein [Peribacillus deserti]